MDRHIGYLRAILHAIALDMDRPLSTVDILSTDEHSRMNTWNDTLREYPDQLCLHHLFEQQAERTPEAIAVVHGDESLTYDQLNARSNRLAHHLISIGVKPDTRVAICVKRSLSMIVGIMAILKAGGAYVPLDPLYTSERLLTILDDTAPTCVVADSVGMKALGEKAQCSMATVDPNGVEPYAVSNPLVSILTSRHLAYVIYTSGTTGKPKGVMVEHQGVVSLVTSRQTYLAMSPSGRMTQFFSVSFDPSLLEIFGTIGFGGALHVIPEDIRVDRIQLWDYLVQNRITHAILTPAVLQDCGDLTPLESMSTLLIGGEAL
ncbi:hypothetical protein BGZ68_003801, partial [Mortierella alpina]